jgi:hypothetical protein
VASVLLIKHYFGDKMEKNEMGRSCSMYGQMKGVYRVLVGKLEGRRSLGRPRLRWKHIIKMDLYKVGWGAWIGLICLRIGTGCGHFSTR